MKTISKLKWMIPFIFVGLMLGCAYSRPQNDSPKGSSGSSKIPLSKEKTLGRAFLQEALKQFQFVKDPEVTQMVQNIGRRIVQAKGGNPDNYRFFVVRGSSLNAFAVPGGYIFLFDSLLSKFKNVDELAGVLAHEIAHVERNHAFQDQNKIMAANLAALIAIILSRGEPAVAAGGLAAAADLQLRYSRENEAEADAYAVSYLKKAGFNPRSLLESLRTIAFYDRLTNFEVPIYFSTHPSLGDRQGHLELMLKEGSSSDRFYEFPVDWEKIQVSLKVGEQPILDRDAIVGFGQEGRKKEQEHYLAGIGYRKAGRCQEAVQEYQSAIKILPERAEFHAELAYCQLQLQGVLEAKNSAVKALQLDSEQPIAHMVMGKVFLHEGRPNLAISNFETALVHRPTDHLLQLQLAQSYGQVGEESREAYYMGRFFRLDFKPREALTELFKAQDLVKPGTDLSFKIKKEIEEILHGGI